MSNEMKFVNPRLAGAMGMAEVGKDVASWWRERKAEKARRMPKNHPFSGDITCKPYWGRGKYTFPFDNIVDIFTLNEFVKKQ